MSATWDEVLAKQQAATTAPGYENGRLAREWVVPPFTVLDTSQGYWKERRRRWLALGIESEIGRGMDGGALDQTESITEYATGYASHPSYRSGLRRGALDVSRQVQQATGMAAHPAHRREADQRSNLTGAATLPDYADFGTALVAPGTSIFDPVLCECAYRWWCPPGGTVLDPFAGGSVRGIVAAMLGHPYTGVDLSAEQVAANREQAARIVPEHLPQPRWYVGDSREVVPDLPAGQMFDMVLTCPPYYDLEVYSEDPRDLSAMSTYAEFVVAYREVIAAAVARLSPGRLAAIVVSDVRGKDGYYVGLRRDTEAAFEAAGARKYNEAVLVNAVGTLAMRAMRQMEAGRKLGRMHQDVLVFARGQIRTHDWSREREAPPDPQQSLDLLPPEPAPPAQRALLEPAEVAALYEVPEEMLPADSVGITEQAEAMRADLAPLLDEAPADVWTAEAPAVEALPEAEAPALASPPRPLEPTSTFTIERQALEVHEPVTAERGRCQRCGAEIERGHEHPPWCAPEQAEALRDAGIWPEEAGGAS